MDLVQLLEMPDQIRGFEEIKIKNAALVRQRTRALLEQFQKTKGEGEVVGEYP